MNFTDNPQLTPFTPYTPQLPVEAMAAVGAERQQMYYAGVQKIQSEIDNVAGLDIYRDVDKNYLQSKLNELGNRLTSVAAGDFSNFQLVNSVSGMTKQLVKDRSIQNAVQSTAHIRNQFSEIEKAKKAGKSSPSNEYVFQSALANYTNNSEIGATFNDTYKEYFDIWKYGKEVFDAIKPGNMSWDELYVKDPETGAPKRDSKGVPIFSPIMMRHMKEGIDMSAVKSAINQIFSDSRVQEQLSIDGVFNYRNYTPTLLQEEVKNILDDGLKQVRENLNIINANIDTGDPEKREQYKAAALKLEQTISDTEMKFKPLLDQALTNPTAVKQFLNKKRVTDNFTNIYGASYEKTEVMTNPGYEAKRKDQEFDFQQRKFWADYNQKESHFQQNLNIEKEKLFLAKQKALKEAKDQLKTDVDKFTIGGMDSNFDPVSEGLSRVNNAEDKLSNAQLDLLTLYYKSFNDKNLSQEQKREFTRNLINNIKIPQHWLENRIQYLSQNFNTFANQEPAKVALFNKYNEAKKEFNDVAPIKAKFDAAYGELPQIGNTSYTTNSGKQVTLTGGDLLDLSLALVPHTKFFESSDEKTKSEKAKQRLKNKGLEEVFQDMNDRDVISSLSLNSGNTMFGLFKGLSNQIDLSLTNSSVSRLSNRVLNSDKNSNFWNNLHQFVSKLQSPNVQLRLDSLKSDLKSMVKNPVISTPIFTGNNEKDRGIREMIKNQITAFEGKNAAAGFDKFKTEALKEGNTIKAIINSDDQVELVAYDANLERIGGMILTPDMVNNYSNLNVSQLRTIQPAVRALDYMNTSKGNVTYDTKTFDYDINDVNLYKAGGGYLNKSNFPYVQNKNYDVQANFRLIDKIPYPYIYINDKSKKKAKVIPLEAAPFLTPGDTPDQMMAKMLITLNTTVTDNFVNSEINKK
jgi:hypothetical protein